ncbi:MAG: heme o synthase [Myxococcota bacterium]
MTLSMDLTPTRSKVAVLRDYVALTKPAINRMCLIMAGGGMFLASRTTPGAGLGIGQALLALVGTALAIASANALNMWLERDTDRLMKRTKDRPLASDRISPDGALAFGVVLGVVAVVMLALGTNLATTLVGGLAIVSYVGVYTPMKYKAPLALVVGAIPGAVPPLMGWTAVTGRLDLPALVLFGVLFIWQIPHFIAIAVFRGHDYEAAGIRTVAAVRGVRVARRQAIAWAVAIVPMSLLLVPTGVAGWVYGASAAVLGIAFAAFAVRPILKGAAPSPARWARRLFVASLIYLPALVLALTLDAAFN